jgi:hypothetical protein
VGQCPLWSNLRVQPKTAFSRFPPIHWANLEEQQRVDLTRSPSRRRMAGICALKSSASSSLEGENASRVMGAQTRAKAGAETESSGAVALRRCGGRPIDYLGAHGADVYAGRSPWPSVLARCFCAANGPCAFPTSRWPGWVSRSKPQQRPPGSSALGPASEPALLVRSSQSTRSRP